METPRTTTSLNDRLNTSYVNLGEENTLRAQYTKFVTGLVGDYIKPRYVFWEILHNISCSAAVLYLCGRM